MAISLSINLLALDIGGVVARIDVNPFRTFLKKNHIDEQDFFDGDFLSMQIGKIKPADFFKKKTRDKNLILDLLAAFKMIINAHDAREVLRKIKIPFFFLSNINPIHFHELKRQIELTDFTNKNSRLSYQVGCLKPAPDFFTIKRSINAAPWQILFIDDVAENLLMAQSYGYITAQCGEPALLSTTLAQFKLI